MWPAYLFASGQRADGYYQGLYSFNKRDGNPPCFGAGPLGGYAKFVINHSNKK